MLHEEVTEKIIECFYTVYNSLGYAFLEKVYENAMGIELRKAGLDAQTQSPIRVTYDGQAVGEYFADIVVNGVVIVELKAATALREAHKAQLKNYLRATRLEVGLLLNFGERPEVARVILTNDRKQPVE